MSSYDVWRTGAPEPEPEDVMADLYEEGMDAIDLAEKYESEYGFLQDAGRALIWSEIEQERTLLVAMATAIIEEIEGA